MIKFYRVSQNKTWNEEKNGFLWSPKAAANGINIYKGMTDIEVGDIVFHFVNGAIAAISEVTKSAINKEKPHGFDGWENKGFFVETNYYFLSNPFSLDTLKYPLLEIIQQSIEQKKGQMGFTKNGTLSQSYIENISEELALLFLSSIKIRGEHDHFLERVMQTVAKDYQIVFKDEQMHYEDTEQIFSTELVTNSDTNYFDGDELPNKPVLSNGRLTYSRNKKVSLSALVKHNYKCALDNEHNSFIANNGKPYVEAHHIIPMAEQRHYPNINLDRICNVIALCPNCHRMVHFGNDSVKKKVLDRIYDKYSDEIKSTLEIEFSKNKLYKFYKL